MSISYQLESAYSINLTCMNRVNSKQESCQKTWKMGMDQSV